MHEQSPLLQGCDIVLFCFRNQQSLHYNMHLIVSSMYTSSDRHPRHRNRHVEQNTCGKFSTSM